MAKQPNPNNTAYTWEFELNEDENKIKTEIDRF